MTQYLTEIAIGPVQVFIAAARKLRDLWFGSVLLSELSKAVARAVVEKAGSDNVDFIFPAVKPNDEQLERFSSLSVANKILFLVKTDDIALLISQVKEAYLEEIKTYIPKTLQELENQHIKINKDIFSKQLEDFGEFYAAWTPCTSLDIEKSFLEKRQRVGRLLAGRKNLREFQAPTWDGRGIYKSTLDGIYETVFSEKRNKSSMLLKESERLDAIGCIKRFYPLKEKTLVSLNKFPDVQSIAKKAGGSYVCFILGDGDNMGAALEKCRDMESQRNFSKQLSSFAGAAQKIVSERDGCLVYAGGDDVMAILPLNTALDCCDALRRQFNKCIKPVVPKEVATPPSFSIGMAIVHQQFPLDKMRDLAKKAEGIAKNNGGRNALAVIQSKRSGSDITIFGKWEYPGLEVPMCQRLQKMVQAYRSEKLVLPAGLGYALRLATAENEDNVKLCFSGKKPQNAGTALALGMFRQKRISSEITEMLFTNCDTLRQASDELVIAKQFADALKTLERGNIHETENW